VLLTSSPGAADGLGAFLFCIFITPSLARAGNVLLTSSPAAAHGFRAKVSDFGLARQMDINSRIQTQTSGTVSYMALEVTCRCASRPLKTLCLASCPSKP
jgi:hypothetical protein